MTGPAIETSARLQCPHGGQVQIVSSNTRVKAGAAMALSMDTFTVTGCPFQIPAAVPIPSPCVTVRWILSDLRVKVNGTPTLSRSSAGLCLSAAQAPQGPVAVVSTQTRVTSE